MSTLQFLLVILGGLFSHDVSLMASEAGVTLVINGTMSIFANKEALRALQDRRVQDPGQSMKQVHSDQQALRQKLSAAGSASGGLRLSDQLVEKNRTVEKKGDIAGEKKKEVRYKVEAEL